MSHTNQEMQNSIVLTIIERLNQAGEPFGIRALVEHCQMSDKTISKTVGQLEAARRLRVIRGKTGTRHEYVILDPPTKADKLATALHLGEPINWG